MRHRSGSIRIEPDELAVEVCEIRGGAVVEAVAVNAAFGVPAVHFGAARVARDDSAIHGHPPTFPHSIRMRIRHKPIRRLPNGRFCLRRR